MTLGTRIAEFDTWRPGYGGSTVRVLQAGTTDLADVFIDPTCLIPIDAQQLLLTREADDISYGRWAQPLYTLQSYELEIDTQDRTGVQYPPLTTLEGKDASKALVKAAGGSKNIELEDHLARRIDVRDFGEFLAVSAPGASAATNNATLLDAIGAAAALGGGFVETPSGTYQFSNISLPQGVVVRGVAREATVLQSILAGKVVTIAGDKAGLARLTLDGSTLVAGSIGLYAANKNGIVADDVIVKRFETGIDRRGGSMCDWRNLIVSNCADGYKPYGDLATATGGPLAFNIWRGGKVELCGTTGVDLRYVDALVEHNIFENVQFDTNTGKALWVRGARRTSLRNCQWTGNTNNLTVEDGSPLNDDNAVLGLIVEDGKMDGGSLALTGALEQVAFRRLSFNNVALTLTTPGHDVLVEDCTEDGVTIAGISTSWIRRGTGNRGSTSGLTTGNAATKAWAITLVPGQQVYLEAKVIARQQNANQEAFYHIAVAARRPRATLAYDSQSANFTLGDIITGATSGATARVTADTDGGTTGTLSLQDVDGVFIDNETITGAIGGSALANGTQAVADAVLVDAVTALRAASEIDTDWNATFVANGPQIELRVTGDVNQRVEWTCDVEVVSN